MAKCGHRKLGECNVTDSELANLCHSILLPLDAGLTATKLCEALRHDYGRDVECRRVSSILRTDKRFKHRMIMNRWNTARIMEWDVW